MNQRNPQVSGVLPVALGRACRLSDHFMHRDKTYVGIMRLHKEVEEKKLHDAIKKFIGNITQLPPVRSRVKRAERVREIKSFRIIEKEGNDILFETQVQAGTYIRKLIHDIGEDLGVGAHMLELRRTKAGIFEEKNSISLYEFGESVKEFSAGDEKKLRSLLIPAEIIAHIIPILQIKKQVVRKCLTGSPIFSNFLKNTDVLNSLKKGDKICIFCDEQFIGCYNYIGNENILAKPEFVFN